VKPKVEEDEKKQKKREEAGAKAAVKYLKTLEKEAEVMERLMIDNEDDVDIADKIVFAAGKIASTVHIRKSHTTPNSLTHALTHSHHHTHRYMPLARSMQHRGRTCPFDDGRFRLEQSNTCCDGER
jgi:hypothetical protein